MKPAALIHVNTADEKDTVRLLEAIEAKQRQVEELTIAIETLKSEVDVFERRYNAHISRYYLELDKVELETKEYHLRLQLRREGVNEEEIEARVESCFRASRARVDAYEAVNESEPTPQGDKLPDTKAKHLQDLYRKLAKRYHPDKAMDAKEEERREQLMPLINRAYNEQDLETLERLSISETEPEVSEKTATEKRRALHTELRRLNRAASQLRFEINRLKTGRTYQLKQQVENAKKVGTDLLDDPRQRLRTKNQGKPRTTRTPHEYVAPFKLIYRDVTPTGLKDREKKSIMQLKDKVAIITGGGRGIGRAIAIAYAAEGARIVIAARSTEQLDTVATEITESGGEVLTVATDLRIQTEVENLVQNTVDRFGRIDILVNNAGVNPRGLFLDSTDEEWEQGWQINVMGVVRCCRAAYCRS